MFVLALVAVALSATMTQSVEAPRLDSTYCSAEAVVFATLVETLYSDSKAIQYRDGSTEPVAEYCIFRVTLSVKGPLSPGSCFAVADPPRYAADTEYFEMLLGPQRPTGEVSHPIPNSPQCPDAGEIRVFTAIPVMPAIVRAGEVLIPYGALKLPATLVPEEYWVERHARGDTGPVAVKERALLDTLSDLSRTGCKGP